MPKLFRSVTAHEPVKKGTSLGRKPITSTMNINKRKRAGTSRSKSKSTITKKAYSNMRAGFPKRNKRKGLV